MSSRAEHARRKEDAVVAYRLEGLDFDTIAKEVGYRDRSGAWKAYKKALARRSAPADDEGLRESEDNLELARLDELQSKIYDQARRGDLAAFDRVLKAIALRDKIRRRQAAPPALVKAPPRANPAGVVVEKDRLDELREKRRAGQ